MIPKFYWLAADLPAFFLISSPRNRIPLPLYGSGLRNDRILAATCPINCLSIDLRMMVLFFPLSAVVSTLTYFGKLHHDIMRIPSERSSNCSLAVAL